MTKRELIEFLKPFSDDIKLVRFSKDNSEQNRPMLVSPDCEYIIAKNLKEFSEDKLEDGEGYILL